MVKHRIGKAAVIGLVGGVVIGLTFGAGRATAKVGQHSVSTTISWTGNGADQGPCLYGAHWVLSPAKGITSATLEVDDLGSFPMQQNGGGSFAVDTPGEITANTGVGATYKGDNDTAFLKLSHCLEGESPSPSVSPSDSPTPTETPSPTDTGTPSPSSTFTPRPTHATCAPNPTLKKCPVLHGGGGHSHSVAASVQATAFTGYNPVPVIALIAGLLVLGVTALLRGRSRKGA